ncbi:hypothetical protein A2U01_0065947, partial [Trifolium medium]|nr:hypothetical protein [Trifolium medium]
RVYSLLVQQERQYVTSIDESKLIAAATNGNYGISGYNHDNRGASNRGRGHRGGRAYNGGRGRGHGHGNKMCTHCGQTNHIVDNCWKKYGYPPHMQHLQHNGVANNYVNAG